MNLRHAPIRTWLVCAFCTATTVDMHAQSALPKLNLAKPDWTAEDAFSSMPTMRQLSNGSVIVADLQDKEVRLLTTNGNTARQLGRKGSGPGEYTAPRRLIALPNDSTLLLDRDARRILIIDPSAKIVSTQPIPTKLLSGSERLAAADGRGRVYFQFESDEKKGEPAPTTAAVARWTRNRDTFDTVTLVALEVPKAQPMVLPPEMKANLVGRRRVSFASVDDWVTASSGRVAVIYASPYHIEWVESDRTRTIGGTVAIAPIKVTEQDKRYYEPKGPPFVRVYPETKSPFQPETAVVDESENVWVRRYEPFGSATRRWDVFNSKGKHLGAVPIAANRVLLAINKRYAYCARTDDDGLVWLERYSR